MTNHSEWLETNNNQMTLYPVNMAGEVKTYQFISCIRVLLHVDENCHGAKLVCHDVWRTLAVFFKAWFSFINCCSQRTAVIVSPGFSNSWYNFDSTKYTALFFEHEYCVLALINLVYQSSCRLTFRSTLKQKSKASRMCCFIGSKPAIFDVKKNVMCTSEFTLKY